MRVGIVYRITLSYACAAIGVRDERVVVAAPIFRWMVGKHMAEVITWVTSKGGKIDLLPKT